MSVYSKSAMRLVIGTGLVESKLTYLKQLKGPALGVYQIEPDTHLDIWDNWLLYKYELCKKVVNFNINYKDHNELVWNLKYATAMCRIMYLRDKNPLPDENNIYAMANYWKDVYNTSKGKGTPELFMKNSEIILRL